MIFSKRMNCLYQYFSIQVQYSVIKSWLVGLNFNQQQQRTGHTTDDGKYTTFRVRSLRVPVRVSVGCARGVSEREG